MNVYQDKQGKLRVERRISTIADRRVKTPMARLGGTRAGLDNNYRDDMPYVVIGADRRAKTTEMHIYQDKQGKERRIRMADRRVNKTAVGGSRVGIADRRAKTTDDLTEGCPIEPPNPSDTAELLKKYRAALIKAYELGKAVKDVYGIVPPKAIIDWDGPTVTIGLQVN